jgi:hypothetical protein
VVLVLIICKSPICREDEKLTAFMTSRPRMPSGLDEATVKYNLQAEARAIQ